MPTIEQIIKEFDERVVEFLGGQGVHIDYDKTVAFLRSSLTRVYESGRTKGIEECVGALDKQVQASGCHCESHESEAEDIACVKRREEVMEILRVTRTRLNSLKEKTK